MKVKSYILAVKKYNCSNKYLNEKMYLISYKNNIYGNDISLTTGNSENKSWYSFVY
jgi:hypothetical protein